MLILQSFMRTCTGAREMLWQSITNFNINIYEKKIRFSSGDDIYDVIDLLWTKP